MEIISSIVLLVSSNSVCILIHYNFKAMSQLKIQGWHLSSKMIDTNASNAKKKKEEPTNL